MSTCVALVVAGGRSTRLTGEVPKQYRLLGGAAVLRRTVSTFLSHPEVDLVRVVIHPDDRALYDAAVAGLALPEPIAGGATRQHSARNGLLGLEGVAPEWVLIHDAARPFVSAAVIGRVTQALASGWTGAIAALPVVDTLKRAAESRASAGDGERIAATVDRSHLWRAQTPQGFRYREILEAHNRLAGAALTDDAAVAEQAGMPVCLVDGDDDNIKITTEADWQKAERMTDQVFETRVGMGMDVHRFGPGDRVMLCGVPVAHVASLLGHSDADVALHALTDALLGAIAAGDIGSHFPPSDPRWRGAASAQFVRHAVDLVRKAGGAIVNVDVTVICERPRVGPHREAMRQSLSDILALPVSRISVKATTTEGLGFTGRQEGIAAQAVATVRLPVA
jgi:2-C-methyl-D-erythritol 4-phosphate cytidylyltransferase/2-C-methyl-D-erythritol 2,4-cyclodiphosphate synthase